MVVITGFGGISAAGRTSGHNAFGRIVHSALSDTRKRDVLNSLAQLSNSQAAGNEETLLKHSLIRSWDNIPWNPDEIPFQISFTDPDGHQCWRDSVRSTKVRSAAQLPSGFDPAETYPSRHHPRGLQMTVYAASDALGSLGIPWETVRQRLTPDQIGVYASSAMGQQDNAAHGGMLKSGMQGKRTSSRQCPLGLAEMPADFINAYVLGSTGATGGAVGACATFLYNLKMATEDIRSGKRRLVMVGCSEAPLVPEVVEGYNAMTALATGENLRSIDQLSESEQPDYQRASRPFGHNAGFTMGESAQYFILCDDALATELGMTIHAAVGDTFVHADGFKKSISAPGIGNHITMGKALAEAGRWFGMDAVRHGSFVQAHGSSTPQNRTTESEILSTMANAFGITEWPVTAAKAHLGHSLGAASADQLFITLGCWSEGILPGITTIRNVADDVHTKGLNFLLEHTEFDPEAMPLAFLNAKGFGGNNATSFFISPQKTKALLQEKYGDKEWQTYLLKNESVLDAADNYDKETTAGRTAPCYQFGEQVITPDQLTITSEEIRLPGMAAGIVL